MEANVDEDELLSTDAARRSLGVPLEVFNALLNSGLLGYWDRGQVPKVAVEHYRRFGTQWRPELGRRDFPGDKILPAYPSAAPGSYTFVELAPYPFENAPTDKGWLAQFYIRPNPFFWPDPGATALIGPIGLKLTGPVHVARAALPTTLYPDPTGSFAMVMVVSDGGWTLPTPGAFECAYDVASPILDELSVEHDQPLPVAQTVIVGIPSGIVAVFRPRPTMEATITPTDAVPPAPPEELREATALYRQGISTSNPFHSFLALWKAYENACAERGAWRRRHKKADTFDSSQAAWGSEAKVLLALQALVLVEGEGRGRGQRARALQNAQLCCQAAR